MFWGISEMFVYLHVVCVQLSVSRALKCQPVSVWTSPIALPLCRGRPNRWICIVWHLVDQYADSSAWYCNLLLPLQTHFSPPVNLSTKWHKGAFVSVVQTASYGNHKFVHTAPFRNIAYLSIAKRLKDSAEDTKMPLWMHDEAFWGCCFKIAILLICRHNWFSRETPARKSFHVALSWKSTENQSRFLILTEPVHQQYTFSRHNITARLT